MPLNTTSACQPLDAGIIKNFKVHYRKYLINHLITENKFENLDGTLKNINIRDATK